MIRRRFLRSLPRSRRRCWTSCQSSMKVTRAAQWTRTSMRTHTHRHSYNKKFCRQMKSRAVCVCVLYRSADCILLPSFDPETVLQTGKHLLLISPVSETHLETLPAATEGTQRGSSVDKKKSTRYCCSPVFSSDKLLQNANRVRRFGPSSHILISKSNKMLCLVS